MRILITGSNGMLGTDLVAALRSKHEIVGLSDRPELDASKRHYLASISDRGAVRQIVEEVHPELIIHTAAYTDVDGCEKNPAMAQAVNVEGTRNLVECASRTDCYFFTISTDYVFDGKKNAPYVEDDSVGPLSVYGSTKQIAEQEVLQARAKSLIIRSSWLFGANGKNFVDTILKLSESHSELKIVSDQKGCPTYTVDLAAAISRLVDLCMNNLVRPEIVHISNSGPTTWADFARAIVEKAKRETHIHEITSKELGRPAQRPEYSVLNTAKYKQMTKAELRHWSVALDDFLASRHI